MTKGFFHKHIQLRQYFINFAMRSSSRALPSERELAKMFDVSRDTVRASLATMIQEKYLLRVPRKGYFSNPSCISFKQTKQKLVGILIHSGSNVYWDADRLQYLSCIFQEAAQRNYLVQVLQTTRERLLRDISNCELDGLLWLTPPDAEKELFGELSHKCDFPIVALFNYNQPAAGDFIWLDHYQEFFLRTRHLLQCGCKRISSLDFNARIRQGYCDALQEAGIPFVPELLVKPEDFEKRLPELLKQFHADAFSIRFLQYPILRKYLDENGLRVPEDVQIIIDNIKIPGEYITRTCKPFKKLTAAMMKLLAARMAGRTKAIAANKEFNWSIIQGKSTKLLDA